MTARIRRWFRAWQLRRARFEVWAFAPGFGMKLQTFKSRQAAEEFKRQAEQPHIREKFPGDYLAIVPHCTNSYSETI